MAKNIFTPQRRTKRYECWEFHIARAFCESCTARNKKKRIINPLNAELNPICYLLALLGTHNFLHFSTIRVKSLILRLLMSYTYGAPIPDVSRSHTTAQQVSGLRPLTCWDSGFESHRGHGYLSVVSVVCCQLEVSATSWSLVQRSPTDCAASLCVI